MPRVVAVDWGKKRVGIAMTDNLQIIGQPYETIETEKIEDFFKHLCEKEEIETIVFGYPIKLDGSEGENVIYIKKLAEKISKICPKVNIDFIDESYTSKIAQKEMIRIGYKKKQRQKKENIDKISAYLILKDYMVQQGKWDL